MNRRLRLVLPLFLGASLLAAPAPTFAGPKAYQEYVALGDSWSADVVFADLNGLPATNHVPLGCAQSTRNYPKLVARALKVKTFRDATCGSATTKDFYAPQSLPTGEVNPPQFDRLTKDTDLVTVGIGGNDAGFAGGALTCLSATPVSLGLTLPIDLGAVPFFGGLLTNPTGGCRERFTAGGTDQLAAAVAVSEMKLVRALKEIHRRSPKARVLVVDYLDGIPPHACWPLVPITETDMAYLYGVFRQLNAMVKRAARAGDAEFVNTYRASRGHGVCDGPTTRLVEGLGIASLNDIAVAVPAHPNAAGARVQAKTVLKKIRR